MEATRRLLLSPYPQQFYVPPPPPRSQSTGFDLNNKVTPTVLLIIIILAIIFFISGLLHLLVRFLLRPHNRDPDEFDNVTALQGQLQQLFNLHDAGVDQSFIDTLPVFAYKSIIGVKNPFDCAVCLSEFETDDKLRLLPKCSHAFHVDCIDTWLLSHSTCPLCRGALLPDFPLTSNPFSPPLVLVLESGGESSREILRETIHKSFRGQNSQLGSRCEEEFVFPNLDFPNKSGGGEKKEGGGGEKVVTVKLGKFKSVNSGGGEGSSENNSSDARRCFSMGSFEYVMDANSSLRVPIKTPAKKIRCHRTAVSECGGDSTREFGGLESLKGTEIGSSKIRTGSSGKEIGKSKRESFSVSKIWLTGKREKSASSEPPGRSFSFRFPVSHSVPSGQGSKCKIDEAARLSASRRTISEVGTNAWWGSENGEMGDVDFREEDETRSCHSLDSQASATSFARRTLLWLTGRQNKVVQSSSSTNV